MKSEFSSKSWNRTFATQLIMRLDFEKKSFVWRKFSKSRKNFKVLAVATADSSAWDRFAVQRLVFAAADVGSGAFITTACRSATMVNNY